MHWKAWEQLSKPKSEGGIGFKDIEAFNLALFGKQLWRLLTKEDTLMAKVFKGRYFSKSDPLNAPLGSKPSFAWKSIHAVQELMKQGTRAVIGGGGTIDIWRTNWVGSKPASALLRTKKLSPLQHGITSSLVKVKDLIDESGWEWRKDIIRSIFLEEDQRRIEELRPGGRGIKDNYTWDYTNTGLYSVKSGYWVITHVLSQRKQPQEITQPSLNPIFQKIWQTPTSPKVQHFLWRCLSNCLSVAGNLAYRHLTKEAACHRCPASTETVNHLLFQCTFARLLWAISPVPAPPNGEWSDSLYSNLFWVLNLEKERPQMRQAATLVPWLLWRLWKNRNELVFQGTEYNAEEVLTKASEDSEEWSMREGASIRNT